MYLSIYPSIHQSSMSNSISISTGYLHLYPSLFLYPYLFIGFICIPIFLPVPILYFWKRQWQLTLVLLPGKSHGRRSLVGCSPWGCKESDTTERLHFHFLLACIGEGNGNPLQCSCLENPRDCGAWWAASMGSHRVGYSWSNLAAAAYYTSLSMVIL